MTERSRIWTGNTALGALGDAGPYSAANWRDIWKYNGLYNAEGGVLTNSGTPPDEGLVVTQQTILAAGVKVSPGRASVEGGYYENDADLNLSIAANGSGNPRIDSVILRMDITNQTIRLAILQGTPAATPVPPTLTRNATTYEISIADVDVANGFATIGNQVIFNRRMFHNVGNAVYHTNVQNRSGGDLRTGDIVIWDSANNRAVKTTTSAGDSRVAGVWVGYTANLGYGRVLSEGIGYVRVTGSPALRLLPVVHSGTAKIGKFVTPTNGGTGNSLFAFNLELVTYGAGNGLCLCYVNASHTTVSRSGGWGFSPPNGGNATTGSATFVDVSLPGPNLVQVSGVYYDGVIPPFVSFGGACAHSVPNRIDFDLNVNGVDYATTDLSAADGLTSARPAAAATPHGFSWAGLLLGASGLVTGSVNTITLRYKTAAATATIYNNNVAGQDYAVKLDVINLG